MFEDVSERWLGRESIRLYRGERKRWSHASEGPWSTVEQAALSYYEQDGWTGYAKEGGLVLSLIKACSFGPLPAKYHSVFIEAIYANNIGFIDVEKYDRRREMNPELHASAEFVTAWNKKCELDRVDPYELATNILSSTEERIRGNHAIMTAPGSRTLANFPGLTLEKMLGLYAALGSIRLSQIATAFAGSPYVLRSGWPDLTLWRGTEVVFKEIKGPRDTVRENQIHTVEEVLLPLGFKVDLVKVTAA
jgi:hypothetical protein